MTTPFEFEFEKFHGNGNDFIFIDFASLISFSSPSKIQDFSKKICHRNTGIGADGVIFFNKKNFQILIINSDGSYAATCGNALRCYGLKLIRDRLWDGVSLVKIGRLIPEFLTNEAQRNEPFIFKNEIFSTLCWGSLKSKLVQVAMGNESKIIRLNMPKNSFLSGEVFCVFVQLANPHLVFYSNQFKNFSEEDYKQFGQLAQVNFLKEFSENIPLSNISMVSDLSSPQEFNLVVFERGAGLTLCCGSGAVASRVALETLSIVSKNKQTTRFQLLGGIVEVSSANSHKLNQRILTGPAEYIYKGKMEWF
jgi:diaminopimelate epimerase